MMRQSSRRYHALSCMDYYYGLIYWIRFRLELLQGAARCRIEVERKAIQARQ